MSKTVTVEELRKNLDKVLADVERGTSITIIREGRSIGTLGPTIAQRGIRFPFRNFDPGPRPKTLTVDVVQFLREERDRERG